jgi:catechol 2,3-dioxygenase-like lactoylglutathione lyase family enzyme
MMRLHHTSLICSSKANADKFYEGILELKKIKTSILKSDLALRIFDIDVECPLILYGNEDFAIEVFVTDQIPDKKVPFTHLCLEVEDKENFLINCRSNGLKVNLVPRGDAQICFVQDFDGNLFEIK